MLLAGVGLGAALMSAVRPARASREPLGTPCPDPAAFAEVYRTVQNLALHQPGEEALYRGAIDGMLATVDPYTRLISAADWRQTNAATRGDEAGVGLDLLEEDGRLVTDRPEAGSPAAAAGIEAGETALAVDGRPLRCLGAGPASLLLFGAPGTSTTLTLAALGAPAREVVLQHRASPASPLVTRLYGDEIGYLGVRVFADGVQSRARRMLREIHARAGRAFRGLVIDLRHDPGGLIEQAAALADLFVRHGTLLTVMERNGRHTEVMKASGRATETGYPVVVLVDERTASAAEAFAAALRENRRALLVGTRTLGKGTVQDFVPLTDGSVLEITKARFLTPRGRSLDGAGLMPDLPPQGGSGSADAGLLTAAYLIRHWSEVASRLDSVPALR